MQVALQPKTTSLSAAARSAEQLFETKNVAEIREIEARTRRDIEDKSQQLRQLVGDSYRDLIEGSENIVDIHSKCKTILQNVNGLQESFAKLAVSVSALSKASPAGQDFVRKHAELHSVGGRIKYLLDTPEVLWSCLDGRQYMAAARRLLRAHMVHDTLSHKFPPDVLAKFPLLAHQWPLVLKFRPQILDIVTNALATDADLSAAAAADATAAIAALEGLSPAAALQRFLGSRLQLLQAQLTNAAGDAGNNAQQPVALVSAAFATTAQTVQTCIAHVRLLFLPGREGGAGDGPSSPAAAPQGAPSSSSSSSLLQQAVEEEAADASELYFGAAYGLDEGAASPEAVAWRQQQQALATQLGPLPGSQVAAACDAWVAQVAAFVSSAGAPLLQSCSDASALLAAQEAVLAAISSWAISNSSNSSDSTSAQAAAATTAGVPPTPASTGSKRSAAAGMVAWLAAPAAAGSNGNSSPAADGSQGAAGSGSAAAGDRPWVAVAQEVLGKQLSVWQALFKQPFLVRCQQLVAARLDQVAQQVQQPLGLALLEAASSTAEAPGQLAARSWPSAPPAALAAALAGGAGSSRLSRTLSIVPGQAPSYRDCPPEVCQEFDDGLRGALQEALQLMAAPSEPSAAASRAASSLAPAPSSALRASAGDALAPAAAQKLPGGAAAAAEAAAAWDRAAELQPYMQQQCLSMVRALAGQLEAQLQQLGTPQAGGRGGVCVEQVLLVARVCSSLASDSTMLPVVLGQPASWKAAVAAAAPGASSSSSGARVGSLWPGMHGSAAAAAGGGALPLAAQQQLQLGEVHAALRKVANKGYLVWAAWVAQCLSADLASALADDPVLRSTTVPLSWVETHVGGTGVGLDADDDTIRFSLPAAVSPPVLSCLMRACCEAARAGGHAASTAALQLLAWELQAAVLHALQQLPLPDALSTASSSSSSKPLSDKGILQLLFDQRLVADVLLGGRPVEGVEASSGSTAAGAAGVHSMMGVAGATTAAAAAADPVVAGLVSARRKQVVALEQQLEDQLDPIDWATYEPHLWANVRGYYRRVHVLLGTLCQLERAHPDTPAGGKPAPVSTAEINTLNILPVVPRFQYLPISMPTNKWLNSMGSGALEAAAVAAAAAASGAGGGAGGVVDLGAPSRPDAADIAAQYSLADLGAELAASSSRAAAEEPAGTAAGFLAAASAGDMAGAGASALSALQARLQAGGGFSALGSILGDKAAEVSAMAAQGFGDFLPGGAGSMLGASGLLSSFSRKDSPFAGAPVQPAK